MGNGGHHPRKTIRRPGVDMLPTPLVMSEEVFLIRTTAAQCGV